MKKLYILVLVTFISFGVDAQSYKDIKFDYYIDVFLEWGDGAHLPKVAFEDKDNDYIYNQKGEIIKFKTRSGVINYFVKLGWQFVHITSTVNSNSRMYFKKTVATVDEAKEGILFKNDIDKPLFREEGKKLDVKERVITI